MRYLIELSGESQNLGAAEALSASRIFDPESNVIEIDSRALVLESGAGPKDIMDRIALAWSVNIHALSCSLDELDKNIKNIELPDQPFRAKTVRLNAQEPAMGKKITQRIGEFLSARYVVDLESPKLEVRALWGKQLHIGFLVGEVDRSSFESRKSEYREFCHPISLHPRLARALVNLSGAGPGQVLLDPFCGTGGILIEGGLAGCKILGGDIDPRMVQGTVRNLEGLGLHHHDIRQSDISNWDEGVDAIATDPPYGRSASTAKEDIQSLYERAFEMAANVLKPGGKMAIVLPDSKHTELSNMELEFMEPVRVHRSLTRYFCVFRN